ncbi:alpha/beta fold hydrolase [Catelliglobosispora koreensis]|uniref:alpha/beta fold hydrolase n=1 Tax=Catelliglobosispora koreensis TaxID=129052 RepID=UPI00037295FB|nr:alpha/beta hydrolase [Catelliglobosispora koreensis]
MLVFLFGSATDPDPEATAARGVTLAPPGSTALTAPAGVVGWSSQGYAAMEFATAHPDAVARLVILATPIPEDEAALGFSIAEVRAKTLLLYGAKDPLTGQRHGSWWQKRLPAARLEMHPAAGHDLLTPMWSRTLSHLAPRRKVQH